MADTIQELYESFAQQMEPIQEDDRYFRYLYEMAQASETTLEQKREVLVKKVDERWISTIEDAMDSINEVTSNPRRFVTTEEELVPVSLARKISSESIRHLSMNTQYIDPSEDGQVHPSKILNVSTQETFDLYENRFVFHLIKRLITFVDKRTDVIFWQTNDEVQNHFVMHTEIDDAYETIAYDVNMVIKDKQSTVENEQDNMDVFMRIDRIRRRVLALRRSAFYELMDGCQKVRSPIQRTNLIMHDPDYRNCYQLWQFIEGYDEVGYSIEIEDTEMAFDDEYMVQMYTNLVNNYAVFKSLTMDARNLSLIETTRQEVKKPVFVKQIEERFVDDCNIPEVEIRQVFVDEVTEKQLAAEAALAEEQEKSAQLEAELAGARHEIVLVSDERDSYKNDVRKHKELIDEYSARTRFAEDAKKMAEGQAAAALKMAREKEDAAAEAIDAREKAEAAAEAARQEVETTLAHTAAEVQRTKAQADQAVKEMREKADNIVASTRAQAKKEIEDAKAFAAADMKAAHDEVKAKVKAAQEEADARVKAAQDEAAAGVKAAQDESKAAIAQAKNDANLRVADAEARSREQLAAVQTDAAARIASAEEKASIATEQAEKRVNEATAAAKAESDAAIAKVKDSTSATLEKERKEHDALVAKERESHAAQIERERNESAAALKKAQDSAAETVEKMRSGHEAELKAVEERAASELSAAKREIEELRRQLKNAERERDRAQRKAEGNSVSRLLRKRLQTKDDSEGEDEDE